jgi:mannose-1-phosphate guanylyltransferase
MLPVAGVPFTVHQITRARDAGVTRIVLATSYKAEVFREFIDDADLGIEVVIATEDEPLGTGGAIRHALPHLDSGPDDPVLVFNGDVLSGVDIDGLVRHHRDTGSDVTLYLTPVDDPRAYGLVPTDQSGRVTAFLEKPKTAEEIVTHNINAGCYVFTRRVIDRIPAGRPVSARRSHSSRAPAISCSALRRVRRCRRSATSSLCRVRRSLPTRRFTAGPSSDATR